MMDPIQAPLHPDDKLVFSAKHVPSLKPGDYNISVAQSLTAKSVLHEDEAKAAMAFSVDGPRTHLAAGDVAFVYPPDGGQGAYGNVLPHIILNRSTLPWERAANSDGAPWLMLVMFSEEELTGPSKKVSTPEVAPTWGEMKAGSAAFPKPKSVTLDVDKDSVRVIDVDAGLLKTIVPSAAELPLLAHVREVASAAGETSSSACLISARLPRESSRNTVYLVSVEDRYSGAELLTSGTTVRLIVLHSWSFYCDPKGKSFAKFFDRIQAGTGLRVPLLKTGNPEVQARLDAGFVPLSYKLRTGESTVAWYHGPLVPVAQDALDLPLPATSADALLIADRATGLMDASYAAAWILGRSIALADTDFALKVYRYKRDHAKKVRLATQWLDCHYLPVVEDPRPSYNAGIQALDQALAQKIADLQAQYDKIKAQEKARIDAECNPLIAKYNEIKHSEYLRLAPTLGQQTSNSSIEDQYLPEARAKLNQLNDEIHDKSSKLLLEYEPQLEKINVHAPEGKDQPLRDILRDKLAKQLSFERFDEDLRTKVGLQAEDLPGHEILEWLNGELSLLRSVPFQYLVPSTGLLPGCGETLPPDSIRFFNVDALWIEALRDGALSVGRLHRSDVAEDTNRHLHFRTHAEAGHLSGCLIRSAIVREWPELEVQAYGPDADPKRLELSEPLNPLVRRLLAPGVLLCLFHHPTADASIIVMHPRQERLHFGVEEDLKSKDLRQPDGSMINTVIELNGTSRKLNIKGLADHAKATHSGTFALNMIESPPRGVFTRKQEVPH